MAKKQEKVVVPEKPQWEIKDRSYILIDQAPLGYHLRTQNVFVFDEEQGVEREITYSRNQRTIFVDEMKGDIRPAHIWFRDGYLFVPKTIENDDLGTTNATGNKSLVFPFVEKNSDQNLKLKHITDTEYNTHYAYGEIITGSYPLSASFK